MKILNLIKSLWPLIMAMLTKKVTPSPSPSPTPSILLPGNTSTSYLEKQRLFVAATSAMQGLLAGRNVDSKFLFTVKDKEIINYRSLIEESYRIGHIMLEQLEKETKK